MIGILLPFLGTSLGAACVFVMRKSLNRTVQSVLTGFAAGVMVAASVWSLLLPALSRAEAMGKLRFVPAVVGFAVGVAFLLVLDRAIPYLQKKPSEAAEEENGFRRTAKLVLAVTIHNLPEGMAVGAVYAGWLAGEDGITLMAATILSFGIAMQNFPEGAIVSMPVHQAGMGKCKAFSYGVLSGVVEPIAAIVTVWAAHLIVPMLPYLLSFAAGAMLVVVVEELIPDMSENNRSDRGTVWFAVGFLLMMSLDVALG